MKMRYRPIRGEQYTVNAEQVTVLDVGNKYIEVLLPNGKTTAVKKNDLGLTIIDTKNFEKLTDE